MSFASNVTPYLRRLVGPTLLAVALAVFGQASAEAASVHVTGTVTGQSGSGVENVTVSAAAPGGTAVEYGPSFTDTTGAYELDVDPGSYDFHFVAPSGSGLNPVVFENFAIMTDQVLSVQMNPVTHTFSGILRTSSGTPLADTEVGLRNTSLHTTTDSLGHFSLVAPVGNYGIFIPSFPSISGIIGLNGSQLIQYSPTIDLTTGDVAQDIVVHVQTLSVTVNDTAGNPVAGASVRGYQQSGGSTPLTSNGAADTSVFFANAQSTTNTQGQVHLGVFDKSSFNQGYGTQHSDNNLCATYSDGAVVCISAPLTIDGDTSVTLTKPVTHTFSGILRTSSGTPLADTEVDLYNTSVHTTTDASGHFTLAAVPGHYGLMIPSFPAIAGVTGLAGSQLVQYQPTIDLSAGDVTQDIVVHIQTLAIKVEDGEGNSVAGATVRAYDQTGGSTPLTDAGTADASIFFANSQGTTNAQGEVNLGTFKGAQYSQSYGANATDNNICVTFADSSAACLPAPLTVTGDTALTFTKPVTHILSGTLRTGDGVPLSNTEIDFYNTAIRTVTDVTGHFTIVAPAGNYGLFIPSFPSLSGVVGLSGAQLLEYQPTIDLTAGDVTHDIVVHIQTLSVTVKDAGGNPVPGASVRAYAQYGGSTPLTTAGSGTASIFFANSQSTTNAQGTAQLGVFKGTQFLQNYGPLHSDNNICVTYPDASVVCAAAPMTVNSDLALVLQPQPTAPAAPAGLLAVTPTRNAPALTWSSVVGAVNYRVYRDAVLVDTVTNPNFVDTGLNASGSYIYTIVAVSSANIASASSAPFTITYDIDNPTISYVFTPAANGDGWNKTDVTATFTCTDALSGIQLCSDPITVSAETGAQTVTGSVTDNAGNPSSVTTTIKLDKTPPVAAAATWSSNPKPVGTAAAPVTTTLTVPAADALSGVAGGEYFIGADPGEGNGLPMAFSAGNLTATFGAGLATGVHDIGARSRDAAGNWSLATESMLVVYDPSIQGVTGKNKQGFTPLYGSDALPWLTSTLNGEANYGFTVDNMANGTLDPHNDFHFTYATGTQCHSPQASNCHDVTLDTTSFAWLAVDQTNNSRARFQGMATMVIDGATTTNPFTVEGLDGDRLAPSVNDTFALKIFAVGADPATATPIYHVNVALDKGSAVKVR